MEYVRAFCRTNLDDFKRCHWPQYVNPHIRVGDWVQSTGRSGNKRRLKVVRIVHIENPEFVHHPGADMAHSVAIEVELHK